jgi:hypothetical protein
VPFHDKAGLRYYTFPLLDSAGVGHAVLTRHGGVSRPPFASLNLVASVGDDPEYVKENRRRAFSAFGREMDSAPALFQIHSDRVLVAERRVEGAPLVQADGLVTDSPGMTLYLRFADCVPILLFDPVHRVAGIVHAGWRGTIAKVAGRAVEKLAAEFGSKPGDILAGIGPSIGPDHYAVGNETAGFVQSAFGSRSDLMLARDEGELRLDLWAANREALREAGVENVEVAGICTACHTDDWYSHRMENGRTGRFGALIWLS